MWVHSLNILSIKIFIVSCNFYQIKSRVDSGFKMYRMFQNMTRYTIVSKHVVSISNVHNILILYYKFAIYAHFKIYNRNKNYTECFKIKQEKIKNKKKENKHRTYWKCTSISRNIFSLHIIFLIFFFKKLLFCTNRITYFETLCIVHSPSLDAGL